MFFNEKFILMHLCEYTPCGMFYRSFTIITYDCNYIMIVIYNHNDSCQYYKTIIYFESVLKVTKKFLKLY
jgi:hypothetical protein